MEVIEITSNTFWKGEVGVKGLVEDQGEVYKASLYVKGGQVFDYSCSAGKAILIRVCADIVLPFLKNGKEDRRASRGNWSILPRKCALW